jgi:hypothetical protein
MNYAHIVRRAYKELRVSAHETQRRARGGGEEKKTRRLPGWVVSLMRALTRAHLLIVRVHFNSFKVSGVIKRIKRPGGGGGNMGDRARTHTCDIL